MTDAIPPPPATDEDLAQLDVICVELAIPPPPASTPSVVTSDAQTSVPPGARGWRSVPTRYYVVLVVAASTMATSVTAYLRPNETSARKGFDITTKALEEQSRAIDQNHDDMVALRAYVDGYVKAREGEHTISVTGAESLSDKPRTPAPITPQTVLKVAPTDKRTAPPPLVHDKPAQFRRPDYASVMGKSDLPL